MTAPQRTVRHLRLTAPSRAQARAMLQRLEDALRCASLPDDGARLLVVRHLALGRLRHDIGASALSNLVERRLQAAGLQWVDADTPAAASADGVVFTSALAARSALASRLLRGDPAPDWYWSPAVPEAPAGWSRRDRLRAIGQAIAQWPEARVALPAWAGGLLRACGGAALAALWSAAEGAALLRRAGLPLPAEECGTGVDVAGQGGSPIERQAGPAHRGVEADAAPRASDELPAWLQGLLMAEAGRPAHAPPRPPPRHAQQLDAAAARADAPLGRAGAEPGRGDLPPRSDAALGGAPGSPAREEGRRINQPGGPAGADQRLPPAPAHVDRIDEAGLGGRVLQPTESATRASPADARAQLPASGPSLWLDGETTAAGGLLFLLPLLARLGLPAWRAGVGDTPDFVAEVLGLALQRLRVPRDDAAWALARGPASGAPAGSAAVPEPATGPRLRRGDAAAPACWQDPRLAPPQPAAGSMAQRLSDASTGPAQAALWLDASRHWLRRIGHIGLASLVLRPGGLALTATHADVHFQLDQTDLRVRRLGLDVDPRWLPWFGRVVAFHYRQVPR